MSISVLSVLSYHIDFFYIEMTRHAVRLAYTCRIKHGVAVDSLRIIVYEVLETGSVNMYLLQFLRLFLLNIYWDVAL